MIALKQRILLVLIVQAVSTLGSQDNADLLKSGQLNLPNCSRTSATEDTRSLESGLKSTVCTVFNNLDEIFKHLLDFPMFYSVPKPTFKNIYKSYEDDSSENYMGISRTSISTGESEAFDIAYESLLSSTESEVELSKNEKAPNELTLDSIPGVKRQMVPSKREIRSKRTVDSNENKQEEYPYVVLIRNKVDKAFKQTGVALSDYIVLTAASGLTDTHGKLYEPSQLFIYSKLPNCTGNVEISVVNIFQNPQLNVVSGEVAKDEIALLEVINPSNISHFCPPLATVDDNKTLPMNCSVLSWNVPDKDVSDSGLEIHHLKKDSVILSDPDKCKQLNPNFNESSSYCSVIKDSPHAYMGDLGAPLICSGELFGFVGATGTKTKGLDLFTRISQFYLFIEENKQKSFKRFANQTWRAKELYDVRSSADNSKRPYMNQLMTSPLILLAVAGFHYFL